MHGSRSSLGRTSILLALLAGLAIPACSDKGDRPDQDGGGDTNDGGTADGGTTAPTSVHGIATYDFVPTAHEGGVTLAFAMTTPKPIRGAVVELRSGTTVVASTTTDATGAYTLPLGETPAAGLVVAVLAKTNTPSITVADNTKNHAVWVLSRPLADAIEGTLDLHATHGWNGTTFVEEQRHAAPFAILDTFVTASRALLAVRTVEIPALSVGWSFKNVDTPNGPEVGYVGGTQYEHLDDVLYVLGQASEDTDEFDRHVLLHEWVEFLTIKVGRVDFVASPADPGNALDPRVSFREGLADALAAALLGDSVAVNTYWQGGVLTGSAVDSETPPTPTDDDAPGAFSQRTMDRVLYDLIDDGSSEAHDTVALGLGTTFDVLTGCHAQTDAFTTLASFVTCVKALPSIDDAAVDAVLVHHGLGAITDAWGAGDASLAGTYTDVTALPFSASRGIPGPLPVNEYDTRAQNQSFRIEGTGARLRFRALSSGFQDQDIYLFRRGEQVAESATTAYDESLEFDTVAGVTYVLWSVAFETGTAAYSVTVTVDEVP